MSPFARLSFFLLLLASVASAHRTGEGYLYITATEDSLGGNVQATLADLNEAVPMDDDGDGEITVEEHEAHEEEVRQYIADRIAVGTEGRDFPLRFTERQYIKLRWAIFVLLKFEVEVGGPIPDEIEGEYRLLFDVLPEHRGLLLIERNDRIGLEENESIHSAVFSPSEPRHALDLNEEIVAFGLIPYLKHGVQHILHGTDHVLFILALLMVSVLRREGTGWSPVPAFRPALINVIKVITLFTIAHSITLSAAALGWIDLSPRIVESIIALSVLAAAVNNIRPFFGDWTWGVVFAFGLFHGMGFASVLTHLKPYPNALVKALLGFNLGVEVGQVAIILLAFPVLYALRNKPFYAKALLPVGSGLIALLAAVWFAERAFGAG